MSAPRTLDPSGSSPDATGTSRRNLLRTFRMSSVGTAVSYAVNLAILPLVLHRIGPDAYGAWVTIASLLMIGALADAGIRTEVVRRVAAARGAGDDRALVTAVHQGVTLLTCSAGGLLLLGLAGAPLVRRFAFPTGVPGLGAAEVDMLVRATVMLLFVTVVGNAHFAVLRGVQRGDIESLGQLIAVPVGAAVTVAGVVWGWGLWAMLAGSSAQLGTLLIWQAAGTRRVVPHLRLRAVRLTGPMARGFLGLSGLALLAQVGDVVDSQWDKIVLSRYVGSAAVTSFQIGTGLALQGKAVTLLVLAPLMAAAAEWRLGRPERLDQLSATLARGAMVVAAVVLGGIVVFAPAFIRLWLPDLDASAGRAARLFVIAVAANLVGAPTVLRALGEGWHRLVAVGALASIAVNAVLSLVLTMAWGFDGALYGSIAGNVAGTFLFLACVRRRLGERWTPPPLAALGVGLASVAAATALGLDEVGSWPGLAIGAGAYAACVGLLAARAERLSLTSLIRRHRVA